MHEPSISIVCHTHQYHPILYITNNIQITDNINIQNPNLQDTLSLYT